MLRLIILLKFILFSTTINSSKDCATNEGVDFIALFPENSGIHALDRLYLHFSTTSDIPVNVRCFTPHSYKSAFIDITVQVEKTQIQSLIVPWEFELANNEIVNKSVRITSDQDIIVYAENMKSTSGDIFLVYPTSRLGKTYVVVSHVSETITNGYASFVAVTTIHDGTTVMFDFKMSLTIEFSDGSTFTGKSLSLNLKKYEVVQIKHHDLCGTIITSSKDIFAVSGNTFLRHQSHFGKFTGDQVMEQLFPFKYMSNEYIVVSASTDSRSADIVRIYSIENYTSVTRESDAYNQSFVLRNAGDSVYFVLDSTSPSVIKADKPISVAQIGMTGNLIGDPYMLLTTPLSAFVNSSDFIIPTGYTYADFSSGLVLVANELAKTSTFLDNVLIDHTSWNRVGQYFYINIAISSGKHSVRTSAEGGAIGGFTYGLRTNVGRASSIGRQLCETTDSCQIYDSPSLDIETEAAGEILSDKFQRIRTDEEPSDFPIRTLFSSNLLSCSFQCLRLLYCAYFTYQESMSTCETFIRSAVCEGFRDRNGTSLYRRIDFSIVDT